MDFFAFEQQQYSRFQMMRSQAPVHFHEEEKVWEIFRYKDVQQVISDPKTFTSDFSGFFEEPRPILTTIIRTDPPRHDELRGLIAHDFTPRAVAHLEPWMKEVAAELIQKVVQAGRMDIVTDFSYPFPVRVITELLGLPKEEQSRFKAWSDALLSISLSERLKERMGIHAVEEDARREMDAYFTEMIEQRRHEPKDDLISDLVQAHINGQQLSNLEILGYCELLLIAGNITTTNLIANAMLCFDEHPEVLEQIRTNSDLLPRAIEESLRYRSPAQLVSRMTTTATTIGGQKIPEKQIVLAWIASANRDETQFPNPDEFNIQRNPNPHLAFGQGIHFCLGVHLARLEAKVAVSAMLEHMQNIRRVPDVSLERIEGGVLLGVKNLPVTFAPLTAGATREPVLC